MTDKSDKPTIFITGASSGIGACLADLAKQAHMQVRTTGRSGGDVQQDLGDPDAPRILADFARGANMAVLNAAIAPGVGSELEMTVNLTRQLQLAILLLQDNPRIKLAFVGSVISGAIIPAYPAYCAAKAGIAAFARALAAEFPGQILLFHPSGTKSKFMERAGVTAPGHLDSTQAVAGRLLTLLQAPCYPWRRPATWKAWAIDWAAKLAVVKGPKPAGFAGGQTLITGAASGLGRALYAQIDGALGLDLKGPDLDSKGTDQGIDMSVDLSQPLPELSTAIPSTAKIDRLINCAGVNWTGSTLEMPYADIARLVQINLRAPLALEAQLAPRQVVQISSLCHQVGYPYGAVYAATKSALAIWGQCQGHVVVYPGPMDTPQAAAARLGGNPSANIGDPGQVATQVIRASAKGQRQLVPGFSNKILRIVGRLAPHISTSLFARDQRRRMNDHSSVKRPTS